MLSPLDKQVFILASQKGLRDPIELARAQQAGPTKCMDDILRELESSASPELTPELIRHLQALKDNRTECEQILKGLFGYM